MRKQSAMASLICTVLALSLLSAPHLSTAAATNKTKVHGIGFSASGLLMLYHFGVVDSLMNTGILVPGFTKLAGSSGGSITAVGMTVGRTGESMMEVLKLDLEITVAAEKACFLLEGHNATKCQAGQSSLGKLVSLILNENVPVFGQAWKKCNGKCFVHITSIPKAAPEPVPQPECNAQTQKNFTISSFTSRADLIAAVSASSFISQSSNGTYCTTRFRTMRARDGGYSQLLPCPSSSKNCLKVGAVLPNSPALPGMNKTTYKPDIYPGVSGAPLPIPSALWDSAVLNATLLSSAFDQIYSLGQQDALWWAKQNGWA